MVGNLEYAAFLVFLYVLIPLAFVGLVRVVREAIKGTKEDKQPE